MYDSLGSADLPRRRWSATILLLTVAAPALALLAGCSDSSGNAPSTSSPAANASAEDSAQPDDAIAVRAHAIDRAPLSSLYTTSATLRSDRRATVTARTQGVIRSLLVEEGDSVIEGQPLARLEDDEQTIEYDRASTTLETRWREFERAERLHGQGLLSDEEYEQVRRDAQEAKHAADLAELVLSRTVIRAPFAGRILARHLDAGATVSDGVPVYDLADVDPLYADVNVPERQIARLAAGQQVRLIADASGQTTMARIERIAPVVDADSGTVKVTLSVNQTSRLRPGSFVRVEIVTETHQDALVVPRTALVAEGRRWHLFRVTQDGEHVERIEVRRGFEERDSVEILGPVDDAVTLGEGDRVVHTGAAALTDGARIRLVDDAEAAPGGEAAATGDDGVAS